MCLQNPKFFLWRKDQILPVVSATAERKLSTMCHLAVYREEESSESFVHTSGATFNVILNVRSP